MPKISDRWDGLLAGEYENEYFLDLEREVEKKYEAGVVYPKKEDVYRAFLLVPPEDVKVVVVGQDPYINEGEANGLAFSVNIPKLPPSLKNIYKEMEADVGVVRESGDLSDLARKGVLFLNRVLTVDKGLSKSHAGLGWERFTLAVIKALSENYAGIVFILWGNDARKLKKVIDADKHCIIEGVHPSPLSSYRGFFGSKPFSKANDYLRSIGKDEIDWSEDE